jgi:hypothetical protein
MLFLTILINSIGYTVLSYAATLPNRETTAGPGPSQSDVKLCGQTPYDPQTTVCVDGMLCSIGLSACGSPDHFACYDSSIYHCTNGQLEPGPSTATPIPTSSLSQRTPTTTVSPTTSPTVVPANCPSSDAPKTPVKYCQVFQDEFDTLNQKVWKHDVTLRGGGNWEFQWYTNNRSNSYVRDSKLFLKPTFTADNIGDKNVRNGYTMDLWRGGACTE